MCRPPSSRHIPCAVHLESWQKLACERHGGACLLLLSAAARRSVPATFVDCDQFTLLFASRMRGMEEDFSPTRAYSRHNPTIGRNDAIGNDSAPSGLAELIFCAKFAWTTNLCDDGPFCGNHNKKVLRYPRYLTKEI